VAATLSHEKASNLSANSADFWFLCRATRDFIANEVPLRGHVRCVAEADCAARTGPRLRARGG
jgi:hypothetical protein